MNDTGNVQTPRNSEYRQESPKHVGLPSGSATPREQRNDKGRDHSGVSGGSALREICFAPGKVEKAALLCRTVEVGQNQLGQFRQADRRPFFMACGAL